LTLIAASTGFFAAAKKEEKSSFRCTMQFGWNLEVLHC
jgi:hypothetical protein